MYRGTYPFVIYFLGAVDSIHGFFVALSVEIGYALIDPLVKVHLHPAQEVGSIARHLMTDVMARIRGSAGRGFLSESLRQTLCIGEKMLYIGEKMLYKKARKPRNKSR